MPSNVMSFTPHAPRVVYGRWSRSSTQHRPVVRRGAAGEPLWPRHDPVDKSISMSVWRPGAAARAPAPFAGTGVSALQERKEHAWHSLGPSAVASVLKTSLATGLSAREAERRLGRDGPNEIQRTRKTSA
ncbi:MAG: cation-transporting P-type ATPase, partial [Thermodesulfobacteriota bacterium]